jgi:hypothetical protein
MVCRSFALLVACLASTAWVRPAAAEPGAPEPRRTAVRAVVELFTSQGCSSCPPADKLVGELARDPSIVALSLPIDYWDYLGWKDTLADPRHTARQKAYSKMRGDREVYTPQAVVNGLLHALGSDRSAIEGAIAKSREVPLTLSMPVTIAVAEGRLVVTVAGGAHAHAGAAVWLCPITKAITVAIKRGENQGKTITYFNVARRWLKLDGFDGQARTWTVPVREVGGEGIDAAAVMVQTGTVEKPSMILGAAMASLR